MNKLLFSGCAAAMLLAAGCGPELAETQYGDVEKNWQTVITASYPGFNPPRIAPPTIVDKAQPEALEKQQQTKDLEPVLDSDAPPAAQVDAAADKSGAITEVKVEEAKPAVPVEEGKKAEKPVEKKADAKVDAKADAKAGAEAAGEFTVYEVKAGDTLGSIAQKFYGKASFHTLILKANPAIKDPRQIRVGAKINVPKL